MDFNEANKTEHKVEDQWHYPILTKFGFEPIDKIGIGFVRSYRYKNTDGATVTCTTGANADYFNSSDGKFGYWADLEPHLTKHYEKV